MTNEMSHKCRHNPVYRQLNIFSTYKADLICFTRKIVSEYDQIRKYHNHNPQTTLWHREEEPLNQHETPGRQIKQSN